MSLPEPVSPSESPHRAFMVGILLVAAVVLAYAASLRGEFLWDDDSHVTGNPSIIGPLGLREIWTTGAANYFPLVLTNFWVQHALWGLNPVGYHAVTIAFHAACAVLLWRVLQQLRVPGAWLGAALWALHPVQVESVAWISELKNTQSGFFFLLAILFFLRWLPDRAISPASSPEWILWFRFANIGPREARSSRYYALALICAVFAILSKPSTVMLPIVLGLCLWWRSGRLTLRDTLCLVPFFAFSALASAWTIWEQSVRQGASGGEWDLSLLQRFAIAGRVIWFYFGKLVWPEPLSFIYPRWTVDPARVWVYFPAIAVIATVWLLWRWRCRGFAPALFGAVYFIALLFPVLGFFNVYFFRYSFVGDHFQYLASMGPLALFAAAIASEFRRQLPLVGTFLLIVVGYLTWHHTLAFRSNETLWRTTVARSGDVPLGLVQLGSILLEQGHHDEAIALFNRALRVNPGDFDAHNNLGCVFLAFGRFDEALAHFWRAVEIRPAAAELRNNLGHALHQSGRGREATLHLMEALRLRPGYTEAHNNLGCALTEIGQPLDALPHFETAIRRQPDDPDIHHNFANALRMLGRLPEAIARYEQALRLDRNRAETHDDLGVALAASGRMDEAISHYRRALALRPNFASAHTNLGIALGQTGRLPEALEQLERALQAAPDYAPAELNKGIALSGLNRWPEARAAFARAAQLLPDSAEAHRNLAIALANTGALDQAVAHFETALRLEPDSAQTHAYLSQALQLLGRVAEAAEHRSHAEALSSQPPE